MSVCLVGDCSFSCLERILFYLVIGEYFSNNKISVEARYACPTCALFYFLYMCSMKLFKYSLLYIVKLE